MQQHNTDTKVLFLRDKITDSFANHFASIIPKGMERKDLKDHIGYKTEVLWKGKPLSVVKTFGTKLCKLCAKERLAILKLCRKTKKAINVCNEIYGACRHKPRFHRFDNQLTSPVSTDESVKDERVGLDSATSASTCSSRKFKFSPESQAILQLSSMTEEQVKERITEGLRARFNSNPSGSSTTSVVGENSSPDTNEVGDPLDMVVFTEIEEVESEPNPGQSLLY